MRIAVWLQGMSVAVAIGLAPAPGFAQDHTAMPSAFSPTQRAEIVAILRDALRTDPSILRDAVAALQQDEQRRQAAAATSAITGAAAELAQNPQDPVAGNPAGDVTVVEFYDPRCPYCRRMLPTLTQFLAAEPGVRLVLKDLPILGPASQLECRALLAAQRQDGYLRLQAALMQAPPDATEDSVRDAAGQSGLDWPRLRHDMDDPDIARRLAANLALAQRLGIQGTPALVIGGQIIPGAVELAELRQAVGQVRAAK
jgi:protein-disulfide isomerase